MDDIELEIDTPAQDSFNAPADEDQDMEEGEIATPDDQDLRLNLNRRKPLHERLGPRVPKGATFGIENDFSGAGRFKLPDLVQELGGASGLTNDPEFSSKLTARAKRFQLENHLAEPTFEDFQAMKKSLIPDDLKEVRAEAIHVTGFGSKVQSNDLGDYFKDFSPISCEWIDGKSANVIWGVDASAAKALCYMSRPVTRSEADSEMESETNTEELLKKFQETKFNEPIDLNEFKLPDPPAGGPWRLGKPSGHDNFDGTTAIYMRLAFKDDIHKPLKERDLNMKNFQLRREGILSRSKKERIQQTLEEHQRIAIEHEESKKYKHLGSDPWGAIAEDWAGTKKAPKNFDDELAFVKDMMTRKRPIGNRSIDWDAPNADDQAEEEDDDDLVRVPRRGVKRQRLIARDGSESPPSTTLKLSEVQGEDPWTTKSKKPRMQMYADTVGEKSSAKQRIFGSIKRQVPNRPRTEIFEEETSEPEIDDSYVDAREKLKSIRVKAASFDTPSNAGRSNIFGSGGKKSNIRDRLGPGKSYDGYQSGDSLERDTGADLDPYNNSDKIQIRVTHSDNEDEQSTRRENRKDRNNDEAMEEDVDAHRDLDLRDRRQQRKSSPPKEQIKDLRSKISSEVVKIKTEKGEEDRRMRENRERKRRENEEREAEAAREARRRQRSERRVDNRDDQDDRRRRRENERRRNDSRGGHTRSDRDFRVSHPPALSEFRREEARLDRGNRDRDNDRDRGIDRNNRNREDRNVRDRGSERRSDRERDTRRRDERRDSKKPLRIKKEKVSDDESSSSDSSSSDSDSDSSSSSSSSSSSDSGSSDSDSDSSSSSNASQRKRRTQKSSKDSSKKTDSKEGIKDKLQEYLARAKEKRRRGGGK